MPSFLKTFADVSTKTKPQSLICDVGQSIESPLTVNNTRLSNGAVTLLNNQDLANAIKSCVIFILSITEP